MADNSLLEKVLGLQEKYEALQAQLSDPEVISDMKNLLSHLVVLKNPLEFVTSLDDRSKFLILLVELYEFLHI